MTAPASPTVRRRRLAAELRGIREDKGKSGDAVAAALRWSPSKISRYERARTGLRPREVERLLDYYGITGSHRDLLLDQFFAVVLNYLDSLLDKVSGLSSYHDVQDRDREARDKNHRNNTEERKDEQHLPANCAPRVFHAQKNTHPYPVL